MAGLRTSGPFNPMETYKNDFRCIAADLRNAPPGQSTGPLEIDPPWDAHSDDQLGLMDYLGIGEFLVMGFCIGGLMIHNLLRLASDRIVAAALMQPSGFRPEMPDIFYQNNIAGWGLPLCEKRPEFTMDVVHDFLTSMYTDRADFVYRFPKFRAWPTDTHTDSATLLHPSRPRHSNSSTGDDGESAGHSVSDSKSDFNAAHGSCSKA